MDRYLHASATGSILSNSGSFTAPITNSIPDDCHTIPREYIADSVICKFLYRFMPNFNRKNNGFRLPSCPINHPSADAGGILFRRCGWHSVRPRRLCGNRDDSARLGAFSCRGTRCRSGTSSMRRQVGHGGGCIFDGAKKCLLYFSMLTVTLISTQSGSLGMPYTSQRLPSNRYR